MISIDITAQDAMPDVGMAPDSVGGEWLLRLTEDCEVLVNFDQLRSLYEQTRGWFEEITS